MPSVVVNSANINTFFFSLTFDLINRRAVFSIAGTTYSGGSGGGLQNVLGASFSLVDSQGIALATFDFTDSANYIVPSFTNQFTVDLSSFPFSYMFQSYSVYGGIKDQDGNVYQTTPVYFKVCQPVKFNNSGYVPGVFLLQANCPDDVLTVKEETLFVYDNETPSSLTKSGTLTYPVGTISPVTFSGTPFSNNIVYTGQYRINNDSTATYPVSPDIYVQVVYRTANQFDVTCQNKMGDLMCCLVALQNEATINCNNAKGKAASQKMAEITPIFMIGLAKEINGQDASDQAAFIRKSLSCDCGVGSVGQNEMTPINPSVTNIVLQGVGGTSIGAPTVNGDTKTYSIQSYSYQVAKGDTGDNAFSITVDTTTQNVIKYLITFNYTIQAGYILNAISNDPTLLQQLNNLVTAGTVNLSGLNGKCVIDLSTADYAVSIGNLTASSTVTNIVINGVTYSAPPLFVTNTAGIKSWLDSLTLGTFTVVYNSGILTVFTNTNPNTVSTLTVSSPTLTGQFASTNATLVDILQALIDYLCELTDLQMVLSSAIAVCTLDYNQNVVVTNLPAGTSQKNVNSSLASAICNIASRINNLTAVTCAKLFEIFADNPASTFLGSLARVAGKDQNGNCVAFTDQQLAMGIVQAINTYTDVKAAFCAIDCTVPGSCPAISNIQTGIVGGTNIGFYGLTWATLPASVQTVTLQYKLNSSSTWLTQSNSIQVAPNGSISGTVPVQILGLTPGATYDVRVVNNCGGTGFATSVTVPTSGLITDSYLLDSILYTICGATPVTLYSSASFGPGTVLYTDAGLTTLATGHLYVAQANNPTVYAIDPSTAVVGASTGYNCNNGEAGQFILSNNSATICAQTPTTLYTNGAFAGSGVVYLDAALSQPVTGYSFIAYVPTGTIYNLNSSTGLVGAATGSSCSSFPYNLQFSTSYTDICAKTTTGVFANGVFGSGKTLYTDSGLTTPVTGFLYVSDGHTIFNLNSSTGLIGSALAQACGDVLILNGSSTLTVTAVTGITGFNLTGSIAPGANQSGTHIAFSSSIQFTLTGSGTRTATLRKNGSVVSTISAGVGTNTFAFNSFVVGDALIITT